MNEATTVWFSSSDTTSLTGTTDTMADGFRMALQELLREAQLERDVVCSRDGVQMLAQALMDVEMSQRVGARPHERTETRTEQRNGTRERTWDIRVGTIELKASRVRDGSFYPSLLDPRKRAERALVAVVQEAYVQGVSTRRVDDLVRSLGMQGISKRQVSRICHELDSKIERLHTLGVRRAGE